MALFDSGVPYTRLISVSGSMQRYRMMRYVMVLGIVLVTIFLYVSYYTTPMASVDNRYASYVSQEQRMPPTFHETGDQNFYSIGGAEGNTSGAAVPVKEQQQQQQPEESSGPGEAAKRSSGNVNSSSNSSGDGVSIKKDPEVVGGAPQVEATKEQEGRPVVEAEVKTNLTAGEKDASITQNAGFYVTKP